MNKKISIFIAIVLILLLAAALRIHTFYLPHNHGDQVIYLGLAMKLEKFGFKEYNLKGIDVLGNSEILEVVSANTGEKGSMLEALEGDNVFYYSKEPISNMPPALSYLLMLSHKLFSRDKLFFSINRNLGSWGIILRPRGYFDLQFYAVWINFVFSLLFILTIFFLGKNLFNARIGLWAAIIISTSALDILTSQRLWTDEMASFFIALCILLYWLGRKNNKLVLFVLSGISAGLAALTKPSGFFVIFIIIVSEMLLSYKENRRILFGLLFNKRLLLLILFSLLVCGLWYGKITSVYGVPWHQPYQKDIEKVSSWFMFLSKRPLYGQLYYFVLLSPILAFLYLEITKTILRKIFSKERIVLLVWFLLFTIMLFLSTGKEERYMLPAYPAIAIFSSLALENIRERLNKSGKIKGLGNIVIILLFLINGIWSVKFGWDCVFNNLSVFDLI